MVGVQEALHSHQARSLCCLHKTLHRLDETPHCCHSLLLWPSCALACKSMHSTTLHLLTLLPSSSSQPQGEPQYSFVSTSEAGVMGT